MGGETGTLSATVLPRGGTLLHTSAGLVQLGVPPETIKDTMVTEAGVPSVFILGTDLFDTRCGVTTSEVEFPAFYNFFVLGRRVRIICTPGQELRVRAFMAESLRGPREIDLGPELPGPDCAWAPDLVAESGWFGRHPEDHDRLLILDDLVEFLHLEPGSSVDLEGLHIESSRDDRLTFIDGPGSQLILEHAVRLPEVARDKVLHDRGFVPPEFGATVLGSGHGFDPHGNTTGFLLWVRGLGILVDPPVDTTRWMEVHGIPPRAVDSILLTHCHADHTGGTLQKILEADRVRLYTTHTIYESFLRKAEAITGLPQGRFSSVVDFVPLPLGRPFSIHG
ncbi:MAG: MBL fold metallo-hydrolase, partial [Myxococcota bacterium]|nr:MBL fold metallo-hydrolase [Myxococcota bacterium]